MGDIADFDIDGMLSGRSFVGKLRTRVFCLYDGTEARQTDSSEVYSQSYGPIWICDTCGAFVGCHKGTTEPLGRLANKELRQLKLQAHDAFDGIWRQGYMKRAKAYIWLAEQMDLPQSETHIGMFDEKQCQQVMEVCSRFWAKVEREQIEADILENDLPF